METDAESLFWKVRSSSKSHFSTEKQQFSGKVVFPEWLSDVFIMRNENVQVSCDRRDGGASLLTVSFITVDHDEAMSLSADSYMN